jgi:hypothetical protein
MSECMLFLFCLILYYYYYYFISLEPPYNGARPGETGLSVFIVNINSPYSP